MGEYMGAQVTSRLQAVTSLIFFHHNGKSHARNEGYGGHEGHACNEEEGSQQDRQGQNGKSVVFRGTKAKTLSGLTKSDLVLNKRGKIVSKKQVAAGKKRYAQIKGWVTAVQKARKALGVKGFHPIKKGTPLYIKAKELYQ